MYAASKDLIQPEKFKGFQLVKFPGSSHFRAYIPNTHKDWKKAMFNRAEIDSELHTFNHFELTPRQMSTLNCWDHCHELHNSGPLAIKAIKRAREAWLRSGITPERIQKAFKAKGIPFPENRKSSKLAC